MNWKLTYETILTSNHIPGIDTKVKKPTFQVGPSMNNF